MSANCQRCFANSPSSVLVGISPHSESRCGVARSSLFYVNCRASALRVGRLLPRLCQRCPVFCKSSVSSLCCKRNGCDRALGVTICNVSARRTSTCNAVLLPSKSALARILHVHRSARTDRHLSSCSSVLDYNGSDRCSASSLRCQLSRSDVA